MKIFKITTADVHKIARKVFKRKITNAQARKVLELYPSEQDADPGGTWDLVIEYILHDVMK